MHEHLDQMTETADDMSACLAIGQRALKRFHHLIEAAREEVQGQQTLPGIDNAEPAETAAPDPRDQAIATAIDELTDVLTLLGQSEARARVQAALQALESIDG